MDLRFFLQVCAPNTCSLMVDIRIRSNLVRDTPCVFFVRWTHSLRLPRLLQRRKAATAVPALELQWGRGRGRDRVLELLWRGVALAEARERELAVSSPLRSAA